MCAALRRSEGRPATAAAVDVAVAPPSALPRAPGWRDRRRLRRAVRRGVVVDAAARATIAVGRDVVFDLAPGARVVLGAGVALGDGCRLHAAAGAEVRVGAATRLGERCVITAQERVTLGAGCLLADDVVLADFDHRFEDVERPVRAQGVTTAPVTVSDGVRIGPAVAVLRGVTIGAGATVGAHAVVTRDVPAGARVLGVPAASPTPPPPRAPDAPAPRRGPTRPPGGRDAGS
jgi:serine acetyltransferase